MVSKFLGFNGRGTLNTRIRSRRRSI